MLRVGSTILVPKAAGSQHADIATDIINNAVMSFEAERAAKGGKRVSPGARLPFKAQAANAAGRLVGQVTKAAAPRRAKAQQVQVRARPGKSRAG